MGHVFKKLTSDSPHSVMEVAFELLECTYAELVEQIESSFPQWPDMGRENAEEWEIDHIRPVSLHSIWRIQGS